MVIVIVILVHWYIGPGPLMVIYSAFISTTTNSYFFWPYTVIGGIGSSDSEALLSGADAAWLRRLAYSEWKDLKLHFGEMETLRCRAEAAGLGSNAFPVFEKRLAILKTILQMQQLLGKGAEKQVRQGYNGCPLVQRMALVLG